LDSVILGSDRNFCDDIKAETSVITSDCLGSIRGPETALIDIYFLNMQDLET
jgi:hypothetical protein